MKDPKWTGRPIFGGRVISSGRYFSLLLILFCAPVCGTGRLHSEPTEKVWHEIVAGNKLIWHIEQPEVRQEVTVYPQILIRASDLVTVTAGGCVQIGGRNHTWKRYLDPRGDNGNLYHGMIRLGAGSAGFKMVPISDIFGRQLPHAAFVYGEEPACPVCPVPLVLGYSDNGYDDNGYGHDDDETDNECNGDGPAWVRVTLEPGYQTFDNQLFSVRYRSDGLINGTLRNQTDRPLPCAILEFNTYGRGRDLGNVWEYQEMGLQPFETRSFSFEFINEAGTVPAEVVRLIDVKHYCEGHSTSDSRFGFYREVGFDRRGGDSRRWPLPSVDACEEACNNDRRCQAYTFVREGVQGPTAICWLKDSVPEPVPDSRRTSGTSPWVNRVRP